MKRLILLLIPCMLFACEKQDEPLQPAPEREITIPEKVEKELVFIISKDWQSLADTLHYFDSTMLRKGKTKGIAPDGIYYELDVNVTQSPTLEAKFTVADSIWIHIHGKISPFEIRLRACDTDFILRDAKNDTTILSTGKIQVKVPCGFLLDGRKEAPLLYENDKVGFLKREQMENLDYTTGTYLIIHFDNDPRTFALYEGGFASLFDLSDIKDWIKKTVGVPDKNESAL